MVYQEILELENDQAAAGRWMSSSVRGLGNHPPISLMGTKAGIQKIRQLVGQLEHGVFPQNSTVLKSKMIFYFQKVTPGEI